MDKWKSKVKCIIDCHVHMGSAVDESSMLSIRDITGIEKMNLVSIQNPTAGTGLPQSLYMKAKYPKLFFVFAGLNHAQKLSEGRVKTPSLVKQVNDFIKIGCDGIKMIEGKPTSRQRMDIPVTDTYFSDFWACVEELGIPIVWHVNDPEEFWDTEKIPGWAKEHNWGYGTDDVQKEQLYDEVDEVLSRHPNLKIIFAHFYFLSADLARAGRFFDDHSTVLFDLAPGIEMLYNLSHDSDASREFFIHYADRIVFGTDISSGLSLEEGRVRAGLVFRWLESDDTFRIPKEADFLLGSPNDGLIHGLSLPDDVLKAIYRGNFVSLAGMEPQPLDISMAIEECKRLDSISKALSNKSDNETEAIIVSKKLKSIQ